jgi:hypothetical protein
MDLDADDLLEDVDIAFDTSELKAVIELAMKMSDIVRSTSEWHRRMTSKKLSQSVKSIDYEAVIPGAKVYFYKPPTAQEVERRGCKAKHLDHYIRPATILRSIGTSGYPGGYCTVPVGTAAVRYYGWVLQGTAGYCWVLRVLCSCQKTRSDDL